MKWYLETPNTTFPEFGQAFMAFLRDQGYQYTGTMDVTAGRAMLDGFFLTTDAVELERAVAAFATANGWQLGGTHHWEFYREVGD